MLWFSLIFSVPGGSIIGIANWWDFTRRRKKLLLENANGLMGSDSINRKQNRDER